MLETDEECEDHYIRRRCTLPNEARRTSPLFVHETPKISKSSEMLQEKTHEKRSYSNEMLARDFESSRHLFIRQPSHFGGLYLKNDIIPSEMVNYEMKARLTLEGVSQPDLDPNAADNPDSFFKSMRGVLLIGQMLTLVPVGGIMGPNYKSIHFKWFNWRTVLSLFSTCGIFFILVCSFLMSFTFGFSYERSTSIVFFASSVTFIVFLLNICKNWYQICREFAEMEFRLKKYGYPKRMGLKFKITAILFMLCAFVEHGLAKYTELVKIEACSKIPGDILSIMEAYFINNYYQIFSRFTYTPWTGLLILYFNFVAAAAWNYADLFLALISWSISERFKQINTELLKIKGQVKPSAFWQTTREDYNLLSVLTKRIDERVQRMMLLSMGDNLFFICLQMLRSFKKRINIYQIVYFFWSFGFLLFRMAFVSFCAAGIYDESKEAKTVVYSAPHNGYCSEIRRFLTQLTTNDVALTGCRFFLITRGLLLTIAGTVVTYEIVLVQFNTDTGVEVWPSETNKTGCATI